MTDIDTITTMLPWSPAREIQTKNGTRMLSKARPTARFWELWRAEKDALKAAGISVGKDTRTDEWEVCWWQPLSAVVQELRKVAVEQSRATSAEIEIPHPIGLDYMPFQKAGIRYALERQNVLFADEMGLGKTIEAIGVINADPTITTAIIVCPKSLKLNWQRELQRWLVRPMSIGVASGSFPDDEIVILNYEAVKKYAAQIAARTWDMCVVDECHFIKNAKAQRSKAVKAIKSTRKIRMSGTPIVNRPAEVQNIIDDLDESFAGFWFLKRFAGAHHNGYGWDFSGAQNMDELQRMLREKIMVRRLKSEVLTELPRKIRQVVEVEADTAAAKRAVKSEQAHEAASENRLADLRVAVELSKAESEEAYRAAVAGLTEASRVDFTEMSRLRHDTAVAKVPAVIEHIKNAIDDNNGHKIIVAIHHHDVADALMAGLVDYSPVLLTGETKEVDRQAAVDRFQSDPTCRVFIGGIQAAGVGITLTASSHVVFAELDWVPGNISQVEDRAHRIGQTDTVLAQHLVLSDSLDARMAHAIVSKQAVIDSALDVNHPERTDPVYEPRASAATQSETVDKLAEVAATLTPEQIAGIHANLKILAGLDDDRARDQNGIGFNRLDTRIGHSLAEQHSLTPRQAALGAKICRKYHRQLPGE